jgi:hypothetical protein
LNGQIPALCNRRAGELAERWGKAPAAGSDAHTLVSLGRTYTQVPDARSKEQFFNGLRRGRAWVCGEHGNYWKLTRAVWELSCAMMREKPWTLLLLPLAMAVPLVTLANCLREWAFVCHWAPRTCGPGRRGLVRLWAEPQQYPEAGV